MARQHAIEVLNSLQHQLCVCLGPRFESLTESPFYAPWSTPKKVHLLKRGDIAKPAEEAVPGVLSCLFRMRLVAFQSDASNDEAQRRWSLADWITHPDNPLFWRSIVNRYVATIISVGACRYTQ